MSKAMQALKDFLTSSPSVVYPDEVLELLRPVEHENEKLRGLASGLHQCLDGEGCGGCPMQDDDGWCIRDILLRGLGVVVDG